MPNNYVTTIAQPVFDDTDEHDMVITRINEVRVIATDENGVVGESGQRVHLDPPDPKKDWVDIAAMAKPDRTAAIIALIPDERMQIIKDAADFDLAKKLVPTKYVELA